MSQEFADQKLIVVGGSSGMGKAVAQRVLQQGGTAVIIGRRAEKLQAAVAELSAYGQVTGEQADISDRQERDALISKINRDHCDATLLVNAAGVFLPKAFLEHTESDYDLYLDLNKATCFVTQAMAKPLR